MSLPSQTSSSATRARYMTSRRKHRVWPWLLLAILVLVVVGYLWWRDPSPRPAIASSWAPPRETVSQGSDGHPVSTKPVNSKSVVSAGPVGPSQDHDVEYENASTPSREVEVQKISRQDPSGQEPAVQEPAAQTPIAELSVAARGASTPPSSLAKGVDRGLRLIDEGRFVDGRRALSEQLGEGADRLNPTETAHIRAVLTRVNQEIFFSRMIVSGDPLCVQYMVKSGDSLAVIAPKFDITYELIGLVNGIDPNRIDLGPLKVPRGPFHAIVTKSEFRLDVYGLDEDGTQLFVRSFPVGLGKNDSTPPGRWLVAKGRKLVNPPWRNPRTREFFRADDPNNPIGEHWIGLKGIDDRTKDLRSYGVHGTIEPASIGQMASMGCVRLLAEDVAVLYALLAEGKSTVEIRK